MTTSNASTKPPIVLIHGLWMTPRSWENWVTRYESYGYEVHTPTYPGLEGEVEGLRRLDADSEHDYRLRGGPTSRRSSAVWARHRS